MSSWLWRKRRDASTKRKIKDSCYSSSYNDNASSDRNPVLSLRNLTYGYVSHRAVIENVSLQISKGMFIGLLGPSGSGKSTLIKIISGLLKPWSGSVEYNLSNTTNAYKQIDKRFVIGYVPQIETVDWNFPVTVREVVSMGIWDRSGISPFLSKNIVIEIDRVLDSLEIRGHEFGKRQIRELSGGEQQRIFLARALIRKPSILVLDEPISGIDHNTREKILSILKSLSKAGLTIIMTTHDLSGIARRLPWVVCMNKKIIAEGTPSEVLTDANLLKTYGLVDNNSEGDAGEDIAV
jgi:ABC-type Mn2+/Zn2+ transport system ATPase subunit